MKELEFGVKLHRGSGITRMSDPVHATGVSAWHGRTSGCKHKFSKATCVWSGSRTKIIPSPDRTEVCRGISERHLWGPAGTGTNHLLLYSLSGTQAQEGRDPSTSWNPRPGRTRVKADSYHKFPSKCSSLVWEEILITSLLSKTELGYSEVHI